MSLDTGSVTFNMEVVAEHLERLEGCVAWSSK